MSEIRMMLAKARNYETANIGEAAKKRLSALVSHIEDGTLKGIYGLWLFTKLRYDAEDDEQANNENHAILLADTAVTGIEMTRLDAAMFADFPHDVCYNLDRDVIQQGSMVKGTADELTQEIQKGNVVKIYTKG